MTKQEELKNKIAELGRDLSLVHETARLIAFDGMPTALAFFELRQQSEIYPDCNITLDTCVFKRYGQSGVVMMVVPNYSELEQFMSDDEKAMLKQVNPIIQANSETMGPVGMYHMMRQIDIAPKLAEFNGLVNEIKQDLEQSKKRVTEM